MTTIHHTGIAVTSIEDKLPFYFSALGMKQLTDIKHDPIQKVRVVLLGYSEDVVEKLFETLKDEGIVGYSRSEPKGWYLSNY